MNVPFKLTTPKTVINTFPPQPNGIIRYTYGLLKTCQAKLVIYKKKLVIYSQAKLFTFIYTYGLLKTCQGRCLCEQRTRANRNYRIPLSEEKLFQDKRTLSSKTEGPCLSV